MNWYYAIFDMGVTMSPRITVSEKLAYEFLKEKGCCVFRHYGKSIVEPSFRSAKDFWEELEVSEN